MYLVRICRQSVSVEFMNLKRELPLCWADGMAGAAPVFDNYDDALKYSGNRPDLIIEVNVEQ